MGLPGVMAPEILMGKKSKFVSDYFGLGVILYEMVLGQLPYSRTSMESYSKEIMEGQVQINVNEIREGCSLELVNFINRLLQRHPRYRLGLNGVSELKYNEWFKDFPWD